jgi:hypothetical protein
MVWWAIDCAAVSCGVAAKLNGEHACDDCDAVYCALRDARLSF